MRLAIILASAAIMVTAALPSFLPAPDAKTHSCFVYGAGLAYQHGNDIHAPIRPCPVTGEVALDFWGRPVPGDFVYPPGP
jgi:hypothetical protein